MRCKYCGSQSIKQAIEHRNFSAGKAVAGTIIFGPIGSVGGFVGKDLNGYRCSACGQFMDAPMGLLLEHQIDGAIADAEAGRSASMFQHYQRQFPNIQAILPAPVTTPPMQILLRSTHTNTEENTTVEGAIIVKYAYQNLRWMPACPVHILKYVIHTSGEGDILSLEAWNQSSKAIRSAYFSLTVYDDTGDEINHLQIVYQGLCILPGDLLPKEKNFSLKTDLSYRVDIICEKVAYTDDAVWRLKDQMQPDEYGKEAYLLTEQPELFTDNFPYVKYLRQHINEVSNVDPNGSLFLPVENERVWQCVCGQPVKAGNSCSHCGATLEKLNFLFSNEYLHDVQQRHVKEIAANRASKTMKLYADAVNYENQSVYDKALQLEKHGTNASLQEAIRIFESILEYSDSAERVEKCKVRILENEKRQERLAEEEKEKAEQARIRAEHEWAEYEAEKKRKKRRRSIRVTVAVSLIAIITLLLLTSKVIIPGYKYFTAEQMLSDGRYEDALMAFERLGDFRDAAAKAPTIYYTKGLAMLNTAEYDEAIEAFNSAGQYEDAEQMVQEAYYEKGRALLNAAKYDEAIEAFNSAGRHYKDAKQMAREAYYLKGIALLDAAEYDEAIEAFRSAGIYRGALSKIRETYYEKGKNEFNSGQYAEALDSFFMAEDCLGVDQWLIKTYYYFAESCFEQGSYIDSISYYRNAAGYEDADQKIADLSELIYLLGYNALIESDYGLASAYFEAIPEFIDSNSYYSYAKIKSIDFFDGNLHNLAGLPNLVNAITDVALQEEVKQILPVQKALTLEGKWTEDLSRYRETIEIENGDVTFTNWKGDKSTYSLSYADGQYFYGRDSLDDAWYWSIVLLDSNQTFTLKQPGSNGRVNFTKES